MVPLIRKIYQSIFQDTTRGLVFRIALFAILMMFCLCGALLIPWLPQIEIRHLMGVFGIVLVPMILSMVMAEFPQGEDWMLFRFALATFCRTGLPLIFLMVIMLRFPDAPTTAAGFMAFFYVFGFFSSIWISLHRFSKDSLVSI